MSDAKYRRDGTSNALISADGGALDAYKSRKAQTKLMTQVVDDINTFKAELDEIKGLIQQLIKNKE